MVKKNWPLARWKKELWKYFSLYVKYRDNFTCFTCGKSNLVGADCQSGHFIPAGACGLELYFNEDNVHVQCSHCNLALQGNQYLYGLKLGKKADELREIYNRRNNAFKYDKHDYERLIEKYKVLL